jgi:hypothetical protein
VVFPPVFGMKKINASANVKVIAHLFFVAADMTLPAGKIL